MHHDVKPPPTWGQQQSEQGRTSERAFLEQLYQDHARAILAYLRSVYAPEQEIEDLLLEVFLVACEQQNLLLTRPPHIHRAWLRRVAHHKLVDVYRGQRRRVTLTLEEVAETLYDDEADAPEQVAMRRETFASVAVVLRRLPQQQQNVVRLRFVYELSCAEIATVVGKREGTVRKQLTRALNRIRRLVVPE